MTILEAFLLTLVIVFVLHLWIRTPRCAECQAKASPHVSRALIREYHRAERNERAHKDLIAILHAVSNQAEMKYDPDEPITVRRVKHLILRIRELEDELRKEGSRP